MTPVASSPPAHHVVCAIDSQMTYGLAVLLASMKATASGPFDVTVGYLDDTLPESDRDSLTTLAAALNVPLAFMPLPSSPLFISQGHISPTTFAKFLLADAIAEAHLWIDADTVVLAGWDQIFDDIHTATDLEGLVVAQRGKDNRPGASTQNDSLRFNAGVLGWPAGQRRDWHTPLSTMKDVATQEQALFNQLYGESAKTIPEAFNTLTYRVEKLTPAHLPAIIHFAGAHKPWHLPRSVRHVCVEYCCPWSAWFDAEKALETLITDETLSRALTTYAKHASSSGRFSWRRDHSGLRLLKALAAVGPVAPLAVGLLRLMEQWVPRGTHPIHPYREK